MSCAHGTLLKISDHVANFYNSLYAFKRVPFDHSTKDERRNKMSIKQALRIARSEGRFVTGINLLAKMWYQAKNLRDHLYKNRMMKALRDRDFTDDPENLVRFAMGAGKGFIRPMQNPREIRRLVERVQELQPKTVLEIGTARGGTLFLFCQSASKDAEIVSLDLPYGKNGGGYPSWKTSVYRLFRRADQKLTLLRANSHLEQSRARVERAIAGKKFDLIMIDADHSYAGVKRDFELYSPLVSERGIIVMHDVLPNPFDAEIDVHRFWKEISAVYQCEEIVDNYEQGCFGLGIVVGLGQQMS
jgi:predicted O-methyltransferase YrrM